MGRKKVSVCFIILNYNDWRMTKQCVDSIEKLKEINIEKDKKEYLKDDICSKGDLDRSKYIIIVDNASNDQSGNVLKKIYQNREDVQVILNKKNEGFARGNNVGFDYIKTHLSPDFVIAVNSDVIFSQNSFIPRLYSLYRKFPFYVAGPDIFVKDRFLHQNPNKYTDTYFDKTDIDALKRQWKTMFFHVKKKDMVAKKNYIREKYRSNLFLKMYYKYKNEINECKYRIRRKNGDNNTEAWEGCLYREQSENVCLQGPCIIFDRRFIDKREYLFRPLTFMYLEEQILRYDCYCNNWNTIYFPQLKVEHLDCGSTYNGNMDFDSFCKKKLWQTRESIKSANIYLRYIDDTAKNDD